MTEQTRGMQLNEHPNYERIRKGEKPRGCPDWLPSHQFSTWQEQGLVVWNSIDKKIETLRGVESLKLLEELNSRDDWKSNGVSISRLVHQVDLTSPASKKRKKGEPEPETEIPKGEDVYQEIIHLPPEAGYELIKLLESKKQVISQMAEQEKKQLRDALRQIYDRLIELTQEKELRDFDFEARSVEWQRDDATRMVCRYQTADGRLWLDKNKIFWNVCVRRENHAGRSGYFLNLGEAVDWVEKEIVELANQPEVKKERQFLSKQEIKANRTRLTETLRCISQNLT